MSETLLSSDAALHMALGMRQPRWQGRGGALGRAGAVLLTHKHLHRQQQ